MTAADSPAATVRHLVRSIARAALGTVLRDAAGAPYVSLVSVATDHDGAPLLLLSDLADHTRNLRHDDRVSLLFDGTASGTADRDDPLAGERVTLQGRLARTDLARHRARYLARHPAASMYADFGDFGFYWLAVERAHLVAGFGRIHWLDDAAILVEPRPGLCEREADIVTHMNADHQDVVQLYATRLLGLPGGGWQLTGVDPEGCDLRSGNNTARLTFACLVVDADSARSELVRLAKEARAVSPPA